MKIIDKLNNKKPTISLEIFPPKNVENIKTVYQTIDDLKDLPIDFISVTYGAGGDGICGGAIDIVDKVKNGYNIEALAHLTCFNSNKSTITDILDDLKSKNIKNILALRGDLPSDGKPAYKDYKRATDLIDQAKDAGFCVGAAAYPEGHIECDSLENDTMYMREKVNRGADFFITQLFFDNNTFYSLLDRSQKSYINTPIIAGIMPILSKRQIQRMVFMCGVSLPSAIIKLVRKYENDEESLKKAGMEYAANQIVDLVKNGVDGIHIYTMNKPEIARAHVGAITNMQE